MNDYLTNKNFFSYRINSEAAVQTFSKSSPTKSQIIVETITEPLEKPKAPTELNAL